MQITDFEAMILHIIFYIVAIVKLNDLSKMINIPISLHF